MANSSSTDKPSEPVVTGRTMPRLDPHLPLEKLAYYKMHFLDDGYPAQRRPGALFEHPLYPIYVIDSYLASIATLEGAIEMVAKAALARATWKGDCLLFAYPADATIARAVRDHVSGLTQGYYLGLFDRLVELFGREEHVGAVQGFLHSLLLPVEEGGPARLLPRGAGIEELPLPTPDLILNGWQSALVSALKTRTARVDRRLSTFIEANLNLLKHLAPRYDVEELANTRYSLAAPVMFKIASTRRVKFQLSMPRLLLDGNEYERTTVGTLPAWQNYVVEKDVIKIEGSPFLASRSNSVRFNLVVTTVVDANKICFELESDYDNHFEVQAYLGEYHPLASGMIERSWQSWTSFDCEGGRCSLELVVPDWIIEKAATPTNFKKVIGGMHRNVYHLIHANRMQDLYDLTGDTVFREFSQKWGAYIAMWNGMEIYKNVLQHDHAKDLRTLKSQAPAVSTRT